MFYLLGGGMRFDDWLGFDLVIDYSILGDFWDHQKVDLNFGFGFESR